MEFDEAVAVASEIAEPLAATEGPQAAASYLSEVAYTCTAAGSPAHSWDLAPKGLSYTGSKRDVAWAHLERHPH